MALAPSKNIKDVITDFISSAPSLEEIIAYKFPDEIQDRAHELLDKNRKGIISETEHTEMVEFREMDHLLTLIKAKAQIRLNKRS